MEPMLIMLIVLCLATALSTTSPVVLWISMEALIICTPFMLTESDTSVRDEISIKYFLIQVSTGLILLQCMVSSWNMMWVLISGLVIKLGLFPAHTWVTHVFSSSTSMGLFFMSVVMKVPALEMVSSGVDLVVVGLVSSVVGPLMGILSGSMKKIIAFSSIMNTGWASCMASMTLSWEQFFIYYSVSSTLVLVLMEVESVESLRSLCLNSSSQTKMLWVLLFLSLAGVPPLVGFGAKWLLLTSLIESVGGVSVVLIVSLSLSFFMYSQMIVLPLVSLLPNSDKGGVGSKLYVLLSMVVLLGGLWTLIYV